MKRIKDPKCRSCKFNIEECGLPGFHQVGETGLFCPLCHYAGNSTFHDFEGDITGLSGAAIECNNCHDYIIYSDGINIDKDESYIGKDYCLIRYPNDKSYFLYKKYKSIVLPGILHFESLNDLKEKLDKIVNLTPFF